MFVLDLNYFGCLRINFSNEMYIMIFTYKNKKYVPVLASVQAPQVSVQVHRGFSATNIKYNMFDAINKNSCNYCGKTV